MLLLLALIALAIPVAAIAALVMVLNDRTRLRLFDMRLRSIEARLAQRSTDNVTDAAPSAERTKHEFKPPIAELGASEVAIKETAPRPVTEAGNGAGADTPTPSASGEPSPDHA